MSTPCWDITDQTKINVRSNNWTLPCVLCHPHRLSVSAEPPACGSPAGNHPSHVPVQRPVPARHKKERRPDRDNPDIERLGQGDRADTVTPTPHLDELPVVLQLLLERLHLLAEVFGVALMALLRLQALRLLLLQLPLQGLESLRQYAGVPLRLPLQVYPVLGQTLRLGQQSLGKEKKRKQMNNNKVEDLMQRL